MNLVKSFREQPTKFEFFFFHMKTLNQCYALISKILTGEVVKLQITTISIPSEKQLNSDFYAETKFEDTQPPKTTTA